ncbi:hypothetical protein CEP54_006281 [Fusarium duplospermum]|uniref:Uncharacterized protein n=1 Tax=Fusarium duplospermum TaxID=1325734 RepID=A0A428Q7P5_9HYPO|nr:hypothetical protein CEP54_006281 [Fusarium duplospermum]
MPPAARIPLSLWEREKEHIRALYLDQDKTLDELVKCMAEEHGFHATKAQYIRRLDSWKMRKYSTKEEWEYVDSLVRKRKLEGKESEIIMDGKPISVKKLKKELGRYGQPRSSEQPCPIPPKDALGAIIAYTPPAIELFDNKLIACTTVPWFLFCDTFIPIVTSAFEYMGKRDTQQFALAMQTSSLAENLLGTDFCVPTVAKTITEKLPKRPGADALKTQSSAQDLFTKVLCWAIYQSSNSLLSDNQTDNFLKWIINHGNIQLLRQFTRINDPVTKILMANLLLSAIRLDSEETVSTLLKSEVKPSAVHHISRTTALQLAAKSKLGNAKIVRLLLEHGACPNTTCPKTHEKRSPLCLAMMDLPRKSSIAEMLILEGADVNVSYWDADCQMDMTPLMAAAAQEDSSLARLLLEKGANPNVFYPGSRSALHIAVRNNRADTASALLRAGADANIPYGERNQLDFTEIFKYSALKELHKVSGSWLTPIDIAYENGDGQAIDLLLQAKAHVDGYLAFVANWHQSVSCIALQDAATRGDRHLIGSLLMAGVDINTFPDYQGGRTALQAAAESGDIDMVQLLLNMGALVNAPPCEDHGLTALQAAIYSKNWDLIVLLLSEVRRQGYDTATPRLNWKKPGSFLRKLTSIVSVDHIQQHNGKHSQCRRLFAGSVSHHYVRNPLGDVILPHLYQWHRHDPDVDRPSFSAIQQKLFPIYFGLQTILPGILALTFPGNSLIGLSNGPRGLVTEFARWHSLLPIGIMALTGAVNFTILLPLTTETMKQRRGQVKRDGKEWFAAGPHSDEMKALNKRFGILHGISSLINLTTFFAAVAYGFTLGGRVLSVADLA